jgi:hypothetical protein
MDTRSFLSRVVPAQGNYLTIQWKSPGHGWALRSYKLSQPDQIDAAVTMSHWAAKKGADTYFAVAAYNVAEVGVSQKGEQLIRAKREQANVHLIKTLVMDCDVKRDGDKKDPATVFPDRRSAVKWLLEFCQTAGFPRPNLAVNSGYGVHFYWILEDALTLPAWQPLANALKAAMMANGWVGDTSPTVDGARLLRPPGTVNMKSGTAVPVDVLPGFTLADYPVQQITDALTRWVGVQQQSTGTHGHSGATVSPIGPRPSHLPAGGTGLNQATRAGLVSHFKFGEIIKKCKQLELSAASQGNGEPYQIWYLGNITLAVFTEDGKSYVHDFSKGDPRYTVAGTDAHITRAEIERDRKGIGAPTCKHYDDHRPGVCGTCPFHGKIKSPLRLGVETDDLPFKYRKTIRYGQAYVERRSGDKDDDDEWTYLFVGEVSNPRLDELPTGGFRLSFTYTYAGRDFPVFAIDADMGHQLAVGYFSRQGMAVNRHTAAYVGDFCMAWIDKLRLEQMTQVEVVRPFGWNFVAGKRVGLAVAGTLYRADGAEEAVAGGDAKVAAMYRPAGDIIHWRKAASLFEGGRADLQALIATSFAAPLISLCGDVRGMTLNFWSTESGLGKSTAIKVGQSVWGDFKAMQSMRDTPNAVMKSLSEPRVLIRYWDELRVRRDYQDEFVEMIFTIPQGKERARLMSDTTLREVGEWETMLVFTSNRPCQDYLLAKDDGTDSGLARLLEIEMKKVAVAFDPLAGQHIKLCETNYGHAGRVYAKYLATNLASVQADLAHIMKGLSDKLAMQRDERFSVTAISCILVGAAVAKKLALFDFDLYGIRDVLIQAFETQREQRSRRTMVSDAGGFDLEELVNEFVYAQADYRIRTDVFAMNGTGKVMVKGEPRANTVRLQIAEAASTLRVSRSSFNEWLRLHNRPASTILDELKAKMGAKEYRKAIGGGTSWGGGAVWVLDIPLTGRLRDLLPPEDTGDGNKGARKSPADAVRDAAD